LPTADVNAGDPVLFRSYRVGTVLGVEPRFERENDWFRVTLGVDSEWSDFVPQGSTTTLKSGLVGGASLEIIAPEAPGAPTLADWTGAEPPVFAFEAQPGLVEDLTGRLMPHIEKILGDVAVITGQLADEQGNVQVALGEFRALMQSLNAADGPIQGILAQSEKTFANVEKITSDLASSKLTGEVEGLVTDSRGLVQQLDTLLASSQGTLKNVETATASLPDLMKSLDAIVARLDTASRTLPGMAEEVRQAIHEANVTLRQVQDVMATLPLVGQPVPRPDSADPIVLPASIHSGGRP
jgi:ABC-type transporter Mla subunit MlaD